MPNVSEELYDVRKIDRLIAEGIVTREQYDAYLASLEDCAADADESNLRFTVHDRGHRGGIGVDLDHRHDEDEG